MSPGNRVLNEIQKSHRIETRCPPVIQIPLFPSSQPVTTKDDICRVSLFSDDQKCDTFLKPEPNSLKRRNFPGSFRTKCVHRFRFFEVVPDPEVFFLRRRLTGEGWCHPSPTPGHVLSQVVFFS